MNFENLGKLVGTSSPEQHDASVRLANAYLDSHHPRLESPVERAEPVPVKTWATERETLAGVLGAVVDRSRNPTAQNNYIDISGNLDKLFVHRLQEHNGSTVTTEQWANSELKAANSPWRVKFGVMYHRIPENPNFETYPLIITDTRGNPVHHHHLWIEYDNPKQS
jgi:hypothetical protein